MLCKIDGLKIMLNQELEREEVNHQKILILSNKIDELITQYYDEVYVDDKSRIRSMDRR